MSVTVSVRNVDYLRETLRSGKRPELNDDAKHNSFVVRELLRYANHVIPSLNDLEEEEYLRISDSVAYLMRPDLLISGVVNFPPVYFGQKTPKIFGEDGIKVHVMNDPDKLNKDWKLLDASKYLGRGGELFRCYAATLEWLPEIDKKLRNGFDTWPALILADITAYLLYPRDLVDYSYTEEELANYNSQLQHDLSEI